MTRKRYVKLLMGHGYSRNKANRCAERALRTGRTYQEDYDIVQVGIRMGAGFRDGMLAVKRAFAETAKACTVIADKLREGMAAFDKACRAAMAKEKEPEA